MRQITLFPLLGYYNNLGENNDYKQICRTLLQNMTKLENMSIHEAAEACYSSPATISRIAKRAGYEGYQGLKDAAAFNCSNYFTENRLLTIDQVAGGNVSDTYLDLLISTLHSMKVMMRQEDINKAVSLIHESDYIFSVGHGRVAEHLEMNLFFDGKYFDSINLNEYNVNEFIENYRDKNVIVIVFNPGYPWLKSNYEHRLKQSGIKVILITNQNYLPDDKVIDCILRMPSAKTSFDAIFHSVIINVIAMTYRKKYIDSWFHEANNR